MLLVAGVVVSLLTLAGEVVVAGRGGTKAIGTPNLPSMHTEYT